MRSTRAAAMVTLTLLMAAGCSPVPKAPPASQIAPPAPADVVTIKVAVPRSADPVLTEVLIPAFEARHKEYQVEAMRFEEKQQLKDAFRDKQVDVVPTDWLSRAEVPLFTLPLDGYLSKWKLDAAPFGGLLDSLVRDGRTYELPYYTDNVGTFVYNVDMAKAAGVTIPADAWTWDEFRAAVAKLKGIGVWGLETVQHNTLTELWLVGTTGQPVWHADLAALRQAIGLFHTMAFTDKSMPPAPTWNFTETGMQINIYKRELDAVTTGRAAMTFEMQTDIKDLPRELDSLHWDVAPMPSAPGALPIVPVSLRTLGIAYDSRQPDAAWDFIAFAAGPEGAAAVARAGYPPPYRSEETHKAWSENREGYPPGVESIWSATWRVWQTTGYAEPTDYMGNKRLMEFLKAQNWALSGQKSLDEALAWFVAAEGGR
ncbi:MAG TPA: extracellular solute-binding protein [Symbiobacteriaceae bacterium]|nr:extracellular solute-binding protein [Symbiobacteriaceae bacterium]